MCERSTLVPLSSYENLIYRMTTNKRVLLTVNILLVFEGETDNIHSQLLRKIKRPKMAKRSFGTVRISLSQNLRSGIFVTSKSAMCQKGKFSWHKGSVGVHS